MGRMFLLMKHNLVGQNEPFGHMQCWNLAFPKTSNSTEDVQLLQALFRKHGGTIDSVNAVPVKILNGIAVLLNRTSDSVRIHWAAILKPALLSYHHGILHAPWKNEVMLI